MASTMPSLEPTHVGPTDAQAWLTLMGDTSQLEQCTVPGSLKATMMNCLRRYWNAAEILVDLTNFNLLFKDKYYRDLCTRWCEGPAAELFSAAIFRKLKASRLEGQWDELLESFVRWVDVFAREDKSRVSFADCERILACHDGESLENWQHALTQLFGADSRTGTITRTHSFLSGANDRAYSAMFERLLDALPVHKWDIRQILWDIQHKSALCKSVMLHVCFWYNPSLKEPAHRMDNKHPVFHHLKPVFCKYSPEEPDYLGDDSWQAQGIALQRDVVSFAMQHWASMKSPESFLREPHIVDPAVPYVARFKHDAWQQLVCMLKQNFSIPFRHPDLTSFNTSTMVSQSDIETIVSAKLGYLASLSRQADETASSNDRTTHEKVTSIIHEEFTDTSDTPDSVRREYVSTLPANIPGQAPTAIMMNRGYEAASAGFQDTGSRKRKSDKIKEEFVENSSWPSQQRHDSSATDHRPRGAGYTYINHDHEIHRPVGSNNHNNGFYQPIVGEHNPLADRPAKQRRADNQDFGSSHPSPPISIDQSGHGVFPSHYIQPRHIDVPLRSESYATPPSRQSPEQNGPARRPMHHNFPADTPSVAGPISMMQTPLTRTSPGSAKASPSVTSRFRILPPPSSASSFRATSFMQLDSSSSETKPLIINDKQPVQVKSKTEQAVELLQEEYGGMELEDLINAITYLKNEVDAGIFLTLKPGPLRDSWLHCLIRP